jgi:hypothetical protein
MGLCSAIEREFSVFFKTHYIAKSGPLGTTPSLASVAHFLNSNLTTDDDGTLIDY